jgi:vancomycin resistance protein YoaR
MKDTRRTSRIMRRAALFFVLALVLLAALALLAGEVWARTDRLFPGLRAGDLALGGLHRSEAQAKLASTGCGAWLGKSVAVRFPDGSAFPVTAAEVGMERDPAALAEALYAYGRGDGLWRNTLSRLEALFFGAQPVEAPVPEPAGEALRLAARRIAEATDRAPVPSVLYFDEEAIRWTRGTPGQETDRAGLAMALEEAFLAGRETVDWQPAVLLPEEADFRSVYALLACPAEDAHWDEEGRVLPEKPGRSFDFLAAQAAAEALEPGETLVIPFETVEPQLTAEALRALLYRDELGSYATALGGTETRMGNIRLAAKSLDGCLLLPGEEFSFNGRIGQRTEEAGYGSALSYVDGEVVSEVGGGICQVSSTLYCACLLADLEVSFRTNHRYFQSYVPPGLDATVSWGWPDFNFVNSTEYPLRIEAGCEGGSLTVTIRGTRTREGHTELRWEVLETVAAGTVYREDPALAPGQRTVADAGRDGMTVQTWRVKYDGEGNVLEEVPEALSVYASRDSVILVAPEDKEG